MDVTNRIVSRSSPFPASPPPRTSALGPSKHKDLFEAQRQDEVSSTPSWAHASKAFFLLGLSALGVSCASQPQAPQQVSQAAKVDASAQSVNLRRSKKQASLSVSSRSSRPSQATKPQARQTRSSGNNVRSDGSVGIRVNENTIVRDDSSVETRIDKNTRVSSDGRVIKTLDNGLSFDSEGNVYVELQSP